MNKCNKYKQFYERGHQTNKFFDTTFKKGSHDKAIDGKVYEALCVISEDFASEYQNDSFLIKETKNISFFNNKNIKMSAITNVAFEDNLDLSVEG